MSIYRTAAPTSDRKDCSMTINSHVISFLLGGVFAVEIVGLAQGNSALAFAAMLTGCVACAAGVAVVMVRSRRERKAATR